MIGQKLGVRRNIRTLDLIETLTPRVFAQAARACYNRITLAGLLPSSPYQGEARWGLSQ